MAFDWNMLISNMVTFLLGGGILGFIGWRAAKRQKEAEASLTETQVDSAELANARELIEMYRASIKDLNELHEKQLQTLQSKYDSLEQRISADQAQNLRKMEKLEAENRELNRKYAELLGIVSDACSQCKYFSVCKKRIDLGITKTN